MKYKQVVKLIIDIAMYLIFVALMQEHLWDGLHEWLGIALFTLFIVHTILNFRWYQSLFKGKYTPTRTTSAVINIALFAAMLCCMVSSVLVSGKVFAFLNLGGARIGRTLRPPLSSHIDQEVMEQYDVIFVGFPIWWYDLPMPVWSFLEEYDLSGKTIIPFFTHNGSSSGASSISTVAELCPDSTVLTDDYFTYSGNNVDEAESAVDEWLTELGYNN